MKLLGKLLAAAVVAAAVPAAADAAVTVNILQVGANVTAVASGTLITTGLTSVGSFGLTTGVAGSFGYVGLGTSGATVSGFSGFTGPTSFGTSTGVTAPTTSTGADFAFNASAFGPAYVFVTPNFVSGGAIASTALFSGATLASLGLTTGSYVYRSANDTITVNIGGAVPEPASWAMMIGGLAAVGYALRRRAAGGLIAARA